FGGRRGGAAGPSRGTADGDLRGGGARGQIRLPASPVFPPPLGVGVGLPPQPPPVRPPPAPPTRGPPPSAGRPPPPPPPRTWCSGKSTSTLEPWTSTRSCWPIRSTPPPSSRPCWRARCGGSTRPPRIVIFCSRCCRPRCGSFAG